MTLQNSITPDRRRSLIKRLLDRKSFIRIMEAHNGISALIANDYTIKNNKEELGFDGIWESSLTDSASKGYPDADIISFDSRMQNIQQIFNVTNKPMIVDGDTGGEASHFEYMVRRLEMIGASIVIIEDKQFPKRNSLEDGTRQDLEDIQIFANKIKRGKDVLLTDDFMIFARLESLIAGWGQDEAIKRAEEYLLAGADGIMIHSKQKTPHEIFTFAENYSILCKKLGFRKPLVCVPTTYNLVTEEELAAKGFNIVIYANHLLRASVKAMEHVCQIILANRRSFEADPYCASVKDIFAKVGFLDIKEKDKEAAGIPKHEIKAIIPAAGRSPEMGDSLMATPKPLLEINGKNLLQRQVDILNRCKIKDISVIRGYKKDQFNVEGVKYYDNDQYTTTRDLHSLFCAEKEINNEFIFLNSDIVFDEEVIRRIADCKQDISLVLDNSYRFHKHLIDKELDLVVVKENNNEHYRKMTTLFQNRVLRVGKKIDKNLANYEFIGIIYFSKQGAENLKKVYQDLKTNHKGKFHEAESFETASITDILQHMIDMSFKVSFIEINQGWMEIHDSKDYDLAQKMLVSQ